MKRIFSLLFNLILLSSIAQIGTIDSTFNPNRLNKDELLGRLRLKPRQVHVQKDGKILVLDPGNPYDKSLIRLNTDGTIDETFNAYLEDDYEAQIMAIQNNGKIIIFKSGTYMPDHQIIRLNNNGSLDYSFNAYLDDCWSSELEGFFSIEGNVVEAIGVGKNNDIYIASTAWYQDSLELEIGEVSKSINITKLDSNGNRDYNFSFETCSTIPDHTPNSLETYDEYFGHSITECFWINSIIETLNGDIIIEGDLYYNENDYVKGGKMLRLDKYGNVKSNHSSFVGSKRWQEGNTIVELSDSTILAKTNNELHLYDQNGNFIQLFGDTNFLDLYTVNYNPGNIGLLF